MIEIFHHWRSSLTPYALFKPTIMAQVPFRIAQAAPITAQIGPAPIAALAFSSPVVFVMSADPSGGTICRKESSSVLRNSDPAPAPLLLLFPELPRLAWRKHSSACLESLCRTVWYW